MMSSAVPNRGTSGPNIYLDCMCQTERFSAPFWEPLRAFPMRTGFFFHRLNEIATHRLGQRALETYRCKPFGIAEPKRWIYREKGRDVSVVVVGSTR